MEVLKHEFDKTAIVIVEVQEDNKAPLLKYITIGILGSASEETIRNDALNYVDTAGKKTIRAVLLGDGREYMEYINNAIKNGVGLG